MDGEEVKRILLLSVSSMNEEISEFLQNEMEICRIIQQVNMDLALHVDLDIAGFQDSIK